MRSSSAEGGPRIVKSHSCTNDTMRCHGEALVKQDNVLIHLIIWYKGSNLIFIVQELSGKKWILSVNCKFHSSIRQTRLHIDVWNIERPISPGLIKICIQINYQNYISLQRKLNLVCREYLVFMHFGENQLFLLVTSGCSQGLCVVLVLVGATDLVSAHVWII